MLTTVEARNPRGSVLTLSLADFSNGFLVRDVEGLDPVKASIISSGFAQQDDRQFQNSIRDPRNIIIKLELKPNYTTNTVKSLRNQLYNFFMPKSKVSLRLYDSEGLTVDISGYVEDCSAPLFSKEPRIDIYILCLNSDFVDLNSIEINGMTVSNTDEILVAYEGSVETGIQFVLNLDRSLSEFTIYHRSPDDILTTFDFAASLEDEDVLTINMIPRDKYITLTRLGSSSSLLRGMSPQSDWIELKTGDNYIRVYAEGAGIPYDIFYTPRYGGL